MKLKRPELISPAGDMCALNTAIESGADEFLNKPFDVNELLIRIGALIKVKAYMRVLISIIKSYKRWKSPKTAPLFLYLLRQFKKITFQRQNILSF